MTYRILCALFGAAAILFLPAVSKAETRALIALTVNSDNGLERALAAQQALKHRHGFDHVEVLTDATPGEIFHRMKVFLEGPGTDDRKVDRPNPIKPDLGRNRRFVWISGRSGRQAVGLCPPTGPVKSPVIRPRYQSIIVTPDCLAATILLPDNALTIRQSTPSMHRIGRYFAQPGGLVGVPVSVVSLPGHSEHAVDQADRAILSALQGAHGVAIRPLAILQALRLRFPPASGPFVPSLFMSDWRLSFHREMPVAARPAGVAGREG